MVTELFPPKELTVIHLIAAGKSERQVAAELGINLGVVKNRVITARQRIHAPTINPIVPAAIRSGQLDLDDVTPVGYDFNRIATLSMTQRSLFQSFAGNDGRQTVKEIAKEQSKSPSTLKNQFNEIRQKLGINNQTQLVVLYLAAKERGVV